ncbi:hypothetical protein, partial [Rosenbergiella nectarea]|uniref:hypothetical protein n=1 Tax=Rosenbergiella nectarea TaxID=988801 RepID=UPI001F4E7C03
GHPSAMRRTINTPQNIVNSEMYRSLQKQAKIDLMMIKQAETPSGSTTNEVKMGKTPSILAR